jgi:hypothetical protein
VVYPAARLAEARADVPGEGGEVDQRSSPQATKADPKRRRGLGRRLGAVGCTVLVIGLVGLCVVVGVVAAGLINEYNLSPRTVEGLTPPDAETALYELSADQLDVSERLGYPEAFFVLFYEEEDEDGSVSDVRFEVWSYYVDGREITFINGELEAEETIGVEPGQLVPMPYTPDQFTRYMSLDEVVAAADLDQYLVVPLEEEFLERGQVYYTDQLAFGLADGELIYVEALALEEAEE